MSWDAIAAIGQMLGSIAVLVTLGYLAVQIRHARDEVRRSVGQSRAEAVREMNLARATNPALNTAYKKALAVVGGPPNAFVVQLMASGEVTFEEAQAIYWDQMAWFNYRMQMIPYLHELSVGDRAAFDKAILQYRIHPLFRLWYETNRPQLSTDAVRYMDEVLARGV